jgi:hypothetical protein
MQNIKDKIFGFTLLKNGVKYDYCFQESLKSLANFVQTLYLALGDNDDNTEEKIQDIKNIKLTHTVWDPALRSGGLILAEQTNIALEALRSDHGSDDEAWGFYLQCDEVIHEADYDLLLKDFQKATEGGFDAIDFRYLHFWQDHSHIAINKKWYPQEIRAVKLNSKIESWGDAQSFQNHKSVYHSNARIFHYGHVRNKNSYKEKKKDILKLYHSDSKMKKYQKREKRFDNQTRCLKYLGPHPLLMKERILELGDEFSWPSSDVVHIVGNKNDYSEEYLSTINADQIIFHESIFDVPKNMRKTAVITSPSFFQKYLYSTFVPAKMESKLAHPWPNDFYLTLKCAEKGISSN